MTNKDDDDYALFAAIQAWLESRVPQRWHSCIWFVLLALAGLGVTMFVAYGIRLILGIGQ